MYSWMASRSSRVGARCAALCCVCMSIGTYKVTGKLEKGFRSVPKKWWRIGLLSFRMRACWGLRIPQLPFWHAALWEPDRLKGICKVTDLRGCPLPRAQMSGVPAQCIGVIGARWLLTYTAFSLAASSEGNLLVASPREGLGTQCP